MDVTPLVRGDNKIIQSYAEGVFRISSCSYEGVICVSPDRVWSWRAPDDFSKLALSDFSSLKDADVVLLGTGAKIQFLPADLRAALKEADIAVEVMDTAAACRTFNVLMAEGRAVVAALYPFV